MLPKDTEIFLKKKRQMCQYASQQYIVNMFANNTEIFLKKLINRIWKSIAENLLKNVDLTEKCGT